MHVDLGIGVGLAHFHREAHVRRVIDLFGLAGAAVGQEIAGRHVGEGVACGIDRVGRFLFRLLGRFFRGLFGGFFSRFLRRFLDRFFDGVLGWGESALLLEGPPDHGGNAGCGHCRGEREFN